MTLEDAEADASLNGPYTDSEVGGARDDVGRTVLQTCDAPPVTGERANRIRRRCVCSPYLNGRAVKQPLRVPHPLPISIAKD